MGFSISLLLAVLVLGSAHPVHADEPAPISPLHLSKEVEWVGIDSKAHWRVELDLVDPDTVEVHLWVQNQGGGPIFLLTGEDWRVLDRSGMALCAFGEPYVNYGNALPALRRLEPQEQFSTKARLDLERPLQQYHRLDVYFYGILDGATSLLPSLKGLKEVAGRWQTGDLELAERYDHLLVEHPVPFPLTALPVDFQKHPAAEP